MTADILVRTAITLVGLLDWIYRRQKADVMVGKGLRFDPGQFDVYDVVLEDRRVAPNTSGSPYGSPSSAALGSHPSFISIRQMLAGVKDMGEVYFQGAAGTEAYRHNERSLAWFDQARRQNAGEGAHARLGHQYTDRHQSEQRTIPALWRHRGGGTSSAPPIAQCALRGPPMAIPRSQSARS